MTESRPVATQRAYPALSRDYPADFRVDDAYKAGLPDCRTVPPA